MEPRLLAIYLNDHRAGAAAGSALARRMARRYADHPEYTDLVAICDEIESDVAALDRVRAHLGVRGGTVERWAALAGERLGRLKPNGRLLERSPLSIVIELELLSAGVAGKRRLWSTLGAVAGNTVGEIDVGRLADRADAQLDRLHELHARAVRGGAFGTG